MSDILEEVNERKLRYKLFERVAVVMTFQVETSSFVMEQRCKGNRQVRCCCNWVLAATLQHVQAHPLFLKQMNNVLSLFWEEGQLFDMQ